MGKTQVECHYYKLVYTKFKESTEDADKRNLENLDSFNKGR